MLFLGKNWPEKFTKLEILKEIPFDPALDCIYSLQYSYNGEVLAVGHGNGAIRVFTKISIYQYYESNAQTVLKYLKFNIHYVKTKCQLYLICVQIFNSDVTN